MARVLIVGCGCRGVALARSLRAEGPAVRGTTRRSDRAASILDHVGDVTLVFWLLGSALGEPEGIAAIHGPRLERLMQKLVDTPVRGFVYEAAGRVQRRHLERGTEIVREAAERWRIPVQVVTEDPGDWEAWTEAMLTATERLIGGARRGAAG